MAGSSISTMKASVRPKQTPRPPIWLGGDVEPAVRRAARLADAWCIAPTLSLRSILARLEVFRDERRKTGQPEDVSCPVGDALEMRYQTQHPDNVGLETCRPAGNASSMIARGAYR